MEYLGLNLLLEMSLQELVPELEELKFLEERLLGVKLLMGSLESLLGSPPVLEMDAQELEPLLRREIQKQALVQEQKSQE